MKVYLMICFVVVNLVLLSPVMARAQGGQAMGSANSKMMEVDNKICPISKEVVDKMGEAIKQEYNGKTYNICCKMCVKDFMKDPQKYSKIAEDEVAKTVAKK